MQHHIFTLAKSALVGFATVAICSCSFSVPKADYLAPSFSPTEINHIAVLPTVDLRVDQSKKLDLDKYVHPNVKNTLKARGYEFTLYTDRSMLGSVGRADVASPSPSWIAGRPPKSDRYVLLMVLNDSTSKITFGSTGNAEVQGMLFDKKNRCVLWREQAIGQTGQGGLIGMAMIGMMEGEAISQASFQVINTIPTRKSNP